MTSRPPKTVNRIAPAHLIAEAARILFLRYEQIEDQTERILKQNAVTKAFGQLYDGCKLEIDEHQAQIVFPSRTRSGISHHVALDPAHCQHTCDCEAATEKEQPCWHVEATNLVHLIADALKEETSPRENPQPAPTHPRNGTAIYRQQLVTTLKDIRTKEAELTGSNSIYLSRKHVAEASNDDIRAWITAARRSLKTHYEQAKAEIDELFV